MEIHVELSSSPASSDASSPQKPSWDEVTFLLALTLFYWYLLTSGADSLIRHYHLWKELQFPLYYLACKGYFGTVDELLTLWRRRRETRDAPSNHAAGPTE